MLELQSRLAELGADEKPGILLKIETREGFDQLPALLLAAMRSRAVGVMIARGDLAVECGYQRLAEVQEEIVWICEAAHTPVISATRVLESLAKNGIPSRSEITDAAMGERAECVMLNKGPYIVTAVRILDDILRRMQAHHAKEAIHVAEASSGGRLSSQRLTAAPRPPTVKLAHDAAGPEHLSESLMLKQCAKSKEQRLYVKMGDVQEPGWDWANPTGPAVHRECRATSGER